MILIIDNIEHQVDITWDETINCYRASIELNNNEYEGITKTKEGALNSLILTLELCNKQVILKT